MTEYFQDKEPKELKDRAYLALAVVFAGFAVLIVRLWFLQVMEASHYRELSLNNRIRLTKAMAPRGLVFDRSGIRLAENRPGFDLSMVPEDVDDMERTKLMLTRLVDLDRETIDEGLKKAKGRAPYRPVKLKEDITWEEMVAVSDYNYELPGVVISVGPKRTYPYGMATAHLMGYVGEISERQYREFKERENNPYGLGDFIGKYGLEASYEDTLMGRDGGKQIEVDARGSLIRVIKEIPTYPGSDMHLTIDLPTQLAAWKAMEGKAGAVVAIDPNNGKVLAMVSAPSFDPNALIGVVSKNAWQDIVSNPLNVLNNRAIQGQYPPASTFKVVTAAAALERKVIRPDTVFYAGPSFTFGRRQYRDWKPEGHGNIAVHSAIVESSDTFFYQVGLKTGLDEIAVYSREFGLGERTGIALANEKSGLVPTKEWKEKALGERWYEGETISVSVGQGYMLVTPLQLLNAYTAIANDGRLYVPQIVERVEGPDGRVIKEFEPVLKKTVQVSPETLGLLRKALVGVFEEKKGTARWLWRDGVRIAGKTGTAQVVKSRERIKDVESVRYKFRDHAWFVGFAPYDDPKIAVAVLVEHGGFGSVAAGPVARDVITAYMESLEREKQAGEAAATQGTPAGAAKEARPDAGARDM